MNAQKHTDVAVLLATYNGSQYLDEQIRSLRENATPFVLHWLDDHSTDNTRDVVRASALSANIELREWHQPHHQGLPGTFFQLLECVEADIYLFCDQDDIWEPEKIDATVTNLSPNISSPVLCFSDSILFDDNNPGKHRRLSDVLNDGDISRALLESQMFMPNCASGHTQGFTRPLREMFLRHKGIARTYAFMHDWWMYNVAVASGTARLLSNAPTVLWRQHEKSFCAKLDIRGRNWVRRTWRFNQTIRRVVSRHAQGFILAAPTLPPSDKLHRLLELARLIAILDRRQSPVALARLAQRGAMVRRPNWYSTALFLATCLSSDALADSERHSGSVGEREGEDTRPKGGV